MNKKKRGLPDGFDLGVKQEDNSKPVELDDYIDREFKPKSKQEKKIVDFPAEKEAPQPKQAPRVKASAKRPRRKEIALDATTERQVSEVISDIQQQGPQPDVSVSEYIRSIAQLGYDVRNGADFSYLKPRGQWGSATAKAFVDDLKESFFRAIGQAYIERFPEHAQQQAEQILAKQKRYRE